MTGTARMGKARLIAGLAFALGVLVIAAPSTSQGAPVFWASGDIIVADSSDHQVEAVNPETGAKVPVATGGNFVSPRASRLTVKAASSSLTVMRLAAKVA